METNNYPVGLLGGHPELLHCVGEKELQRKKNLIQTTLEKEMSGPLEAEVGASLGGLVMRLLYGSSYLKVSSGIIFLFYRATRGQTSPILDIHSWLSE